MTVLASHTSIDLHPADLNDLSYLLLILFSSVFFLYPEMPLRCLGHRTLSKKRFDHSSVCYTTTNKKDPYNYCYDYPWIHNFLTVKPLTSAYSSSILLKAFLSNTLSSTNSSFDNGIHPSICIGTSSASSRSALPSAVSSSDNFRSFVSGRIRLMYPCFSRRLRSGASVPESR